jgi:serine/threonine protein kinase HipA of HipAB toxin-antitoxin module
MGGACPKAVVENAAELFRRMCFSALISNIDGHPRNHALIAKQARPRDGVQ